MCKSDDGFEGKKDLKQKPEVRRRNKFKKLRIPFQVDHMEVKVGMVETSIVTFII
jgi:hypothetical protein